MKTLFYFIVTLVVSISSTYSVAQGNQFHSAITNISIDQGNSNTWLPKNVYKGKINVGALTFNIRFAGSKGGDLVFLLHGWPQSSIMYREQLKALGAAGYFVVAPDQRGYSAGARPKNVKEYKMDKLANDISGMADRLGINQFHLVGHDMGAAVSWTVAASKPHRIRSLIAMSVAHLDALDAELSDQNSCQYQASSYFDLLSSPTAEEALLANNGAALRGIYDSNAVNASEIDQYLTLLGSKKALGATLNWYRANIVNRRVINSPIGSVLAPTILMWGTNDDTTCRNTAERSGDFVATSNYRFVPLKNVGHWIPDQRSEQLTRTILKHINGK